MQQRECSAAPEATQNPPEEAVGDQKGGVAYTDQDRKILQLCGEDLAAAGRTWPRRGGAGREPVKAEPRVGRAVGGRGLRWGAAGGWLGPLLKSRS